jgi:hypothetical protein
MDEAANGVGRNESQEPQEEQDDYDRIKHAGPPVGKKAPLARGL